MCCAQIAISKSILFLICRYYVQTPNRFELIEAKRNSTNFHSSNSFLYFKNDVTTLVKSNLFFCLELFHILRHFGIAASALRQSVSKPQSKRIMADAWLDRTNGYTFQVKRSSSTPTSTISAVINLYVQLIQVIQFTLIY